jgi:hypothetical protein
VHLIDYEGDNPYTDEDEITELEDSNDEPNQSLYKTGRGSWFGDFEFANEPGLSSPGALNDGQILDPLTSGFASLDHPTSTRLLQNAPNPFRQHTRISLYLARESLTEIGVYDISGRRVRRLLATTLSPGRHAVDWNGLDEAGNSLASGAYFYELRVDGRVATRRTAFLMR